MSAEANQNVEEFEEVVQPAEETEHNDVSKEEQESEQRKRNDAEYNWAEMRRQQKKDKERMEALERELQALKSPAPKEEDDFGLNDDDLVEGRYLKDLKKEIKALKSEIKRKEQSTVEDRVQMKYPDFASVVNEETIALLKAKRPRTAMNLAKMEDPYEQSLEVYELIKELGLSPKNDFEKKKIQENSKKPLSVNSISSGSPMGDLNVFSQLDAQGKKEFYKAQYQELQKAIKGH